MSSSIGVGAPTLLAPGFVDIDVAGGTGAGAAAFGFDAREWRCEWRASITVAPFSTSMVRVSPV